MTPRLFTCAALAGVLVAAAGASFAQTTSTAPDTAAVAPATYTPPPARSQSSKSRNDRIYFGGSLVFNMGSDVTTIGVYPMVGYKLRPKWSVGVEAGYEHVSYDDIDKSANNYGGSVFTRYRVIPRAYLHAEYQMINYEFFTPFGSDRDWVPFLLLGGGLSTMVAPRTWAYVEVLFDVLRDDMSPYDDWEPFVSAGVGVGF